MIPTATQSSWARIIGDEQQFSFSGKRDANGYPMATYLICENKDSGQITEISEPNNSIPDNSIIPMIRRVKCLETPIAKIMKDTTPEDFLNLCDKFPFYRITHADRGWNEILPANMPDFSCLFGPTGPLTALAQAAFKGNPILVNAILKAIRDKIFCKETANKSAKMALKHFVNQRMEGGSTAVMYACSPEDPKLDKNIIIQIVKSLIDAGADLNLEKWSTSTSRFRNTDTTLSIAIQSNYNDLAEIMTTDDELTQLLLLNGAILSPSSWMGERVNSRLRFLEMFGREQIIEIRKQVRAKNISDYTGCPWWVAFIANSENDAMVVSNEAIFLSEQFSLLKKRISLLKHNTFQFYKLLLRIYNGNTHLVTVVTGHIIKNIANLPPYLTLLTPLRFWWSSVAIVIPNQKDIKPIPFTLKILNDGKKELESQLKNLDLSITPKWDCPTDEEELR